MRRLGILALILAAITAATPGGAVKPGEALADPALEARARDISKELRCLVCQNQSIDDSDAPLAHDLRLIVRERLEAGDSDDEVIGYITARYGDFVLLKPPFKETTWALWLGPPVILAVAAILLFVAWRRRRGQAEPSLPPLSEAERQRVAELIDGGRS